MNTNKFRPRRRVGQYRPKNKWRGTWTSISWFNDDSGGDQRSGSEDERTGEEREEKMIINDHVRCRRNDVIQGEKLEK